MGSPQHKSDGDLRYEKTDGSSVLLNRFWRTFFKDFSLTPLKKILGSKKSKFDPPNPNLYLRKGQMGSPQHNSDGKLRYEKTDGSSVFLNRF